MSTQEQIDIIREGPLYFLESIWFRIGQMYGLSPGQIDHDSFEERKMIYSFYLENYLMKDRSKLVTIKGTLSLGLPQHWWRCSEVLFLIQMKKASGLVCYRVSWWNSMGVKRTRRKRSRCLQVVAF